MIPNKTVFLMGLFSGLVAGFVWSLIIFTDLNQFLKFIILILGALPFFLLQIYIMKEINQPNLKEIYSSRFWSLTSKRYQKFGVFMSGAFAPYILIFAGYLIVNTINS